MTDLLDYKRWGLVKFIEERDPTPSEPNAQLKDKFVNSLTGVHSTCVDATPSLQMWLGSNGVLYGGSILTTNHANLLFMYTMDNISGSVLVDESPGSNDGTLVGTVASITGVLANALEVTTSDKTNHLIDAASVLPGGNKAISFWLKMPAATEFRTVMEMGGTKDNVVSSGWQLLHSATGELQFISKDGAGTAVDDIAVYSSFPVDTYVHVVWNFPSSASQLFEVYINGLIDTSFSSTVNIARANNDIRVFGNSGHAAIFNAATGAIDQFRLFNRSLTSGEALELYNEGTP